MFDWFLNQHLLKYHFIGNLKIDLFYLQKYRMYLRAEQSAPECKNMFSLMPVKQLKKH